MNNTNWIDFVRRVELRDQKRAENLKIMTDHVKRVEDLVLDGSEYSKRMMERTNTMRIAKYLNANGQTAIGLFDSFVRTDAQRQTDDRKNRALKSYFYSLQKYGRTRINRRKRCDCEKVDEILLQLRRCRELKTIVNRLRRPYTCIGNGHGRAMCETMTTTIAVVDLVRTQQQYKRHHFNRKNRTIQILGMRAAATATANSAQTQTALAHTEAQMTKRAGRTTIATANSAQTPTARMHAPAQTMMTARRKQKQRQQ